MSCKGTLWTAWRFFEHQYTLLYLFVFQVFVFVFVEQGTCISKLFHYSVHCSFMQLCWCRTCLMKLSVTFFLWHILEISIVGDQYFSTKYISQACWDHLRFMYSKKWLIYCYFQFVSCQMQQASSCHLSGPHMLSSYFTVLGDMINIPLCIYNMWNIEHCPNIYSKFELVPLFSDFLFLWVLSNIFYMFGYHLCVIGNDRLTDIGWLLLLYVWYQSF